MHRKITRLAEALKWGDLGDSGLDAVSCPEAAVLRPANAKYPKPADAVSSNSRRVIAEESKFMIGL